MLTLSLLRHAKSSWDDPSLRDFDRPLAKRGIAGAGRIGAFMKAEGVAPQLILCSPAARARQTLDLVLPQLGGKPKVLYEDALYLATPTQLLARARKIEEAARHALIVGHDPGMHVLALELSGAGDPEMLCALTAKFPTAALAVIRFKARRWSKLRPAGGELELFTAPKMLG